MHPIKRITNSFLDASCLLNDTKAQAGGIFMFVAGILITGFFYVAFSAIMDQFETANNTLINSDLAYSQDHWDAMDLIFKYWWAVPVVAIIIHVIFAIKNALTKDPTEI